MDAKQRRDRHVLLDERHEVKLLTQSYRSRSSQTVSFTPTKRTDAPAQGLQVAEASCKLQRLVKDVSRTLRPFAARLLVFNEVQGLDDVHELHVLGDGQQ